MKIILPFTTHFFNIKAIPGGLADVDHNVVLFLSGTMIQFKEIRNPALNDYSTTCKIGIGEYLFCSVRKMYRICYRTFTATNGVFKFGEETTCKKGGR